MNQTASIFDTIDRILLGGEKPSKALNELSETKEFIQSPFGYMNKLKDTEQSKQHHPEGNVWIHTMMVVDEAAGRREESRDPKVLMWAAFLHDIGKPETTRLRKGKITSYDHDKAGAIRCRQLLSEVCSDEAFIEKVTNMVRWHMQILFVVRDMPFADIERMKQQTEVKELALLGMSDRMGRLGANREEVKRDVSVFLKKMGAE